MEITFISALNEYDILIAQILVLKIRRILYKWIYSLKFLIYHKILTLICNFYRLSIPFHTLIGRLYLDKLQDVRISKNFDTIFINYSLRISNLTSVLLSLLLSFENELSFIFWQELVDLGLHPPPNELISSKYEF